MEIIGQFVRVILSCSHVDSRKQIQVVSLGSKHVQPTEPSCQPPVDFTSRPLAANTFHLVINSFKRGCCKLMKELKYLVDCIWVILIYL